MGFQDSRYPNTERDSESLATCSVPLLVRKVAKGIPRCAGAFWRDTNGVILPYVTVMLVAIVGVAVLAVDGSRYTSLQTQLQKGADALALAGAAELDRAPTAITRAVNAIEHLVTNSSVFGTGSSASVEVQRLRFLSALPASDTTAIPTSDVLCTATTSSNPCTAANANRARFVEVTVAPVTISTILPASFFGGSNSVSTTAQAVAGFDQAVCAPTPIFMCNPFEQSGDTYDQATARLVSAGASGAIQQRQLLGLQATTASGAYFPGNFGLLDPVPGSLSGASCGPSQNNPGTPQAMALATTPSACFAQSTVNTQPGNDQNVYNGWNVRFDVWQGAFNSCKNDAHYAPDVNVRKGFVPGNGANGACNASAATHWPTGTSGSGTGSGGTTKAALPFPLDNNMIGSTGTQNKAVAIGNGNWTCGDIGIGTTALAAGPSGSGKTRTPGTSTLTFASVTGIGVGMQISGGNIPSGTYVQSVSSANNQVTMTNPVTADMASGTTITFAGYWSTAHPTGTSGAGHKPNNCTAPATMSRYAVYQAEISGPYMGDTSGGGERGSGAMCAGSSVANRRILYVAVLNCLNLSINGNTNNVPVAAYAGVFMTAPIPTNQDLPYAEFVGLDTPGGGFTYNMVQLYR
jgi:hypothetical protein